MVYCIMSYGRFDTHRVQRVSTTELQSISFMQSILPFNPLAGRLREWFNKPFGSIVIDEDVALTEDEQEDVVSRLKEVIRPFLLQRKAGNVFRVMTEEKIAWLPLSPWQKAVYDAVCEKDVERWAGILGNSGLNNLCSR